MSASCRHNFCQRDHSSPEDRDIHESNPAAVDESTDQVSDRRLSTLVLYVDGDREARLVVLPAGLEMTLAGVEHLIVTLQRQVQVMRSVQPSPVLVA